MVKRNKQRALKAVRANKQRVQQYIKALETPNKKLSKSVQQARKYAAESLRSELRANKNISIGKIKTELTQGEVNRRNTIFKQQIGLANNGQPSILGEYGQQKSKIFYRATQRMWQGKPPQERNASILRGLGVKTLDEALDIVLRNNSESLSMAENADKNIFDTNEPEFAYQEFEDVETSPDYIYMVDLL